MIFGYLSLITMVNASGKGVMEAVMEMLPVPSRKLQMGGT
jgi:hypothetical protein